MRSLLLRVLCAFLVMSTLADAATATPDGESRMHRDGTLLVLVTPGVHVLPAATGGTGWQSMLGVQVGAEVGRDVFLGIRARIDALDAFPVGTKNLLSGWLAGADLTLRLSLERLERIAPHVAVKTGFGVPIVCPTEVGCVFPVYRFGAEAGASTPIADDLSFAFIGSAEVVNFATYQFALSTGLLF